MKMLLGFVAAWLCVASAAQAAEAVIEGRAFVRRAEREVPVASLAVYAFSDAEGRLVRTLTDAEGRFRLAFPPQQAVAVYEDDRGYRIRALNGREGSRAKYDCSQPGACGEAELELERLSVVEGTALGAEGQAVEGVHLELRDPDAPPLEAGRYRRVPRARTDDRGRFRFYGIRPGAYELTVDTRRMRPDRPGWEGDPLPLSVREGSDALGLTVPLRLVVRTTLRGRISGLPPDSRTISLDLRSADGARQIQQVRLAADGGFEIPGVPAGRYAVHWMESLPEGSDPPFRFRFLGMGEAGDAPPPAALQPREPARVRGRFHEIIWPEDAGVELPRDSLSIRLPSLEKGAAPDVYRLIQADGPDYTFDFTVEQGGRYGFQVNGPGPVVEEIAADGSRTPFPGAFDAVEGQTLELALAVRFAQSRLKVTVVGALNEDGSREESTDGRYVVVLRDGERVVTYTTDQNGRVSTRYLRPGNWQIAAWTKIDRERIRDDAYWEAAGDAVRRFEHREAADVEIRLTAVPGEAAR